MLGYKKLAILLLLGINLAILVKLDFFVPQLRGETVLFDFDAYYRLAGAIRSGVNPYKTDLMQTLGPPAVIAYYLPFSFLSIVRARALFSFINLAAGYLASYLLAKKFTKNVSANFLLFSAVLFSSFPSRLSFELGQPNHIVLFLISSTILVESSYLKAIQVALATVIKSFLGLSIFSFARKQGKVFILTFLILVILVLLSFMFIKPGWYLFYFREKVGSLLFSNSEIIGLDYYNQSIRSTLHRVFLGNFYLPVYLPLLVLSFFTIVVTGNFMLSIVLSVLASPVVWQHYFVLFFPVIIYSFFKFAKDKRSLFLLLLSSFFWWIEFPTLHQSEHTLLTGILASHFFISGVLMLMVFYRNRSLL